ncbi:MAG: transglycosylase SLT domain-containing protein [Nitrospirae bacterium]|nr:transglycosylase SLT domain-containing protein [Nitrospirota bacterium]
MIKPTPEIDSFIRAAAAKHNIPYELLYAQVKQESGFNPIAVSHCGARGLLQIMPATGTKDLGLKEEDFFNPEKNLNAGALYLRRQYKGGKRMIETMKCANECADDDYWKLALASYNGGLGYIIAAINICVQDGLSICWPNVAAKLADKRCSVRGKRPDHKQMTDYVERIWADYTANTTAPLSPPCQGGDGGGVDKA